MTTLEWTGAQFTSASTAGIVDVELGFVPDGVIYIRDHGGTNPSIYLWFNNTAFSQWAAALSLLITGSTGVVTRVTSGITVYNGGETIATAETTASDPKHVNLEGTASAANRVTADGIAIPAALQTNSGANIVLAFRLRTTN
jgi:hypothetical protein